MTVSLKDFEKARNYLENTLIDSLQNLEIGIYDPWLKHIFEEGLRNEIKKQFKATFPDISVNFSFSIYLASQTIEYSVQHYHHPFSSHIFLGTVQDKKRKDKDGKLIMVDCYYSSLYESFGEPRIIIRHGHGKKDYEEGAMSAAEQFYNGLDTNLAKGYQLAVEAGYVR